MYLQLKREIVSITCLVNQSIQQRANFPINPHYVSDYKCIRRKTNYEPTLLAVFVFILPPVKLIKI